MAYRLMMCTSLSELLANMIALDKPEYLFYVVERDDVYEIPLDSAILQDYISWKYGIKGSPNDPQDAFMIIDFLGRYPLTARMNVFYTIVGGYMKDFEEALEKGRMGEAIKEVSTREPENRQSILTVKAIVRRAQNMGINSQEDVNRLMQKINSDVRITNAVRVAFTTAIRGRFKYL